MKEIIIQQVRDYPLKIRFLEIAGEEHALTSKEHVQTFKQVNENILVYILGCLHTCFSLGSKCFHSIIHLRSCASFCLQPPFSSFPHKFILAAVFTGALRSLLHIPSTLTPTNFLFHSIFSFWPHYFLSVFPLPSVLSRIPFFLPSVLAFFIS